jgi:hypothetical protein
MKFLFPFLAILVAVVIYFSVTLEKNREQILEASTELSPKAILKDTADKLSPAQQSEVYDQWLKDQFEEKHKKLMPVVSVADMFFTCDKKRQPSAEKYSLKELINVMDKNTLAMKLVTCLGEDDINSDQALNFGLLGCFSEQLSILPEKEQAEKMKIVENSLLGLSREERQKSFTKCISEQAMNYL